MIKANISRFSGLYAALNSVNADLDISRSTLARSMIMVGHAGRREVIRLGLWRLTYLLSLIYAHVDEDQGYLKLSATFFDKLDKTEKVAVSYHLGMALAKASVEILLGVPWLVHKKRLSGIVQLPTGMQLPPKVQLYQNTKSAREPDLIGFDLAHRPHVVEAKGYSSGQKHKELQHAIDQVSQVVSVNSIPPATRVVAFYDMSGHPIRGEIIDPDEEFGSGISINIAFPTYLRDYYSVFLGESNWFQAPTIQRFGRSFKIRAIGTPDFYFGIDEEVLKAIFEHQVPETAFEYFAANYTELNASNDRNIASVGRDGTILLTE